jgi:inorganic pyrophosphatase
MSITSYLEALPLGELTKYAAGTSVDSVPISGFPRQHPSDTSKLLLIHDPLGENPQIMEFKKDDITHVEDIHAAITETGEGVTLVKLWLRKGAIGVLMKPFAVQENLSF